METFKKVEKIINGWIQHKLDKLTEENGRWSQSAWKNGHYWELSVDRFTMPRLLALERCDTRIRIFISNTKRFNIPVADSFVERDINEAITITKTNVSFNEECKFDHFILEEMMDLYNRIKSELNLAGIKYNTEEDHI